MKTRWKDRTVLVVPAFLGLGLILLAVFAGRFGIDHNVTWGGRRIAILGLGIILSVSSLRLLRGGESGTSAQDVYFMRRPTLVSMVCGLCVIFIIGAYVWFATLGRWTVWPFTGYRYDGLAAAFMRGRLDVDIYLDPALPKLPDPYDPDARKDIQGMDGLWDNSLYNGKIYLYFGAPPALIITALKLLFPVQVGDATLTFASICGLFVFESLLIVGIWRRFFADITGWTIVLGLLVAALVHPVPWLLTSPRIYEAAVAAGQCFLVGGFYFAFTGLSRISPRIWHWVLAGTLWSLAVGTRAILVFPILFLTTMVIYRMRRLAYEAGDLRSFLRPVLALIIPMSIGAIAIGWYNWSRFGSVLETGLRYQLGMTDLNQYYGDIFSLVHVPPNLYIYLINPPAIGHVFPFIRPILAQDLIAYFNNSFPVLYNAEHIVGILYSSPFILFALIPAATALAHGLQKKQEKTGRQNTAGDQGLLQWTVFSLLGSFALALLTLLLYFYGTVRYLLEIMPPAIVLAMIGFWQGYRRLRQRAGLHALYKVAAIGLATASILSGVLLSFSSDAPRLRHINPSLLPQLVHFFANITSRFGW